MSDEINEKTMSAYETMLRIAYQYQRYNSAFQQMAAKIDPEFLAKASNIAKAYQHIAAHAQYNLAPFLNLAKAAQLIAPLYQFQRQMAAIAEAIPVQDIVYSNQKIREGIMQTIERIDSNAAEKEQLKNIFQNEELLSCADDIVEEMNNTSNEETPLDNSSAAETLSEKFSLLKHGINLETAVVFSYVLAIAVFVIYCIRTGSLTEDDFYAFWLYIFQLIVGGMDTIENFAAEYPYTSGIVAAIISGLILERLKEMIRRDKEKTVE